MLDTRRPIAFLATTRPDRARAFYAETLDLPLVADEALALVFDLHGVPLRVQKVAEFVPQSFTVLGWEVADAAATVARLRDRGVAFERYPFLEQDADGLWDAADGTRVAWFKDPDGNLLSLTQAGGT